jgi:hypothetical protein
VAVEVTLAPRRMFFLPISWAAIFAALAVGVALQMLFILGSLAFGIAVLQPAAPSEHLPLAATGWSVASMIISAFVAGIVATRASGLRRKSDGMLHGAVAWASMTLIYAVLASTVLGVVPSGVFGALRPLMQTYTGLESVQINDARSERLIEAQRSLEAAGLSAAQAEELVSEMAAASADAQTYRDPAARTQEAAVRAEHALGWLSAAVLLSLIAGVLGGLSGTAGQPRVNRRTDVSFAEARVVTRPVT